MPELDGGDLATNSERGSHRNEIRPASGQGTPAPKGSGILAENWVKLFGNSTLHELSESAGLGRASDSCNLDITVGSDEYYPDPWMVPGYAPFFPPAPWEPMGVWHSIKADSSYRWLQNTSSDEAASSPAVIDINGDGVDEVIGGTTSGRTLEVLNSVTGNFVWTFPTPAIPDYTYFYGWHASPAVADIMPTVAGLEVVAMHGPTNTIYAFQGKNDGINDGVLFSDYVHDMSSPLSWWQDLYDTGELGNEGTDWDLLWFADLKSVGGEPISWDFEMSSPAIADVNADGQLDVVVASQNGYVYVMNGQTGAFLSHYKISDTIASVAIANVNDDPQQEIFIGTIDTNYSGPNSSNPAFYALRWSAWGSPPGLQLLWKADEHGNQIESSASIGDVDGDGRLEVVYGGLNNSVKSRDAITGTLEWETLTDGPMVSSPALADRTSVTRWEMTWPFFRGNVRRTGYLPGSGEQLSVYIGSMGGSLYLLNGTDGSIIDTFGVDPEEFIQSSPVLGDIDGDHRIEVQLLTVSNGWNSTLRHFWSIEDTLSYGFGSTDCGKPVADFGWWPNKLVVGQDVQFTDLSYDTDGVIVAWSWDFDGEGTSSLQNPTFTFARGGTRPVTLTVTDNDGNTARVTKDVVVEGGGNTAPGVEITADPNPAIEGADVTFGGFFDDPDSADTHVAVWSFGDGWSTGGTFSPGPGPGNTHHVMDGVKHAYGKQSSYTACLSVTDQAGGNDTACVTVLIGNVLPEVTAIADFSIVDEGSSFVVDGGIFDPSWNDTWEATWDFGFGSIVPGDVLPPFGYPFTYHDIAPVGWTYGDDGIYDITLTAKDNFGGYDTDTLAITVNNVPPAIEPFGPFTVNEGSPISVSANATDPGSDDLTFSWTFELGPTIENVHYNDGVGPDPSESPGGIFPFAAEDSASYTYGDDGIYELVLTVTDDDGGVALYSTTITVLNIMPTIKPFGPFTTSEGDPLTVAATASDPGSDDLNFTWTFEYGPTIQNIHYNDGVGPDPSKSPDGVFPFSVDDLAAHTYGDNGVFRVSVKVEDDDGGVATYETTVTVLNLPPTILNVEAFMVADITLRVAGEKWHDVILKLYTDGNETGYAQVIRYPGSPDDQSATLHDVKVSLTRKFSAVAYYTPDDDPINGQPNGANPAWLTFHWESGEETRLHHTFNVQHNDTWTWKVDDLHMYALGQTVHLHAAATDPGSDDLEFTWDSGDGRTIATMAYNDGAGPDPYPSPDGVFPFETWSDVTLTYGAAGTYTVTLIVTDDDGGTATVSFTLLIG